MPTAFAFNNEDALGERQRAQMEAQGYFAENLPRQATSGIVAPTSGTVLYMAIGLAAGDRVSNLNLLCSVLGSGFSGVGMKVGLYTKAAVLVAQSGDVSAQFGSVGAKACPLAPQANGDAFYTVPTTDGYFAAVLVIASSSPTLVRGHGAIFASGAFGSSQGAFGSQGAQTDLPGTATISFGNNGFGLWVGAS